MIEIIKNEKGHVICIDGKPHVILASVDGAADTFEKIEEGAWKWHRRTNTPTDKMRMEAVLLGDATFTMVPSVSYNGNG